MMDGPKFETAIPKRRYRVGEFSVVLLGDVVSREGIPYLYILAFVPDGQSEPILYITCEKNRGDETMKETPRMCVIAPHDAQVFGSDSRWADMEAFIDDGLLLGRQLLELMDEEPVRLM